MCLGLLSFCQRYADNNQSVPRYKTWDPASEKNRIRLEARKSEKKKALITHNDYNIIYPWRTLKAFLTCFQQHLPILQKPTLSCSSHCAVCFIFNISLYLYNSVRFVRKQSLDIITRGLFFLLNKVLHTHTHTQCIYIIYYIQYII